MKTASPMHFDGGRVRFVVGRRSDQMLGDRVVEVRKLLRTDLPIVQIAEQLGVSANCLKDFVRRRNLCDLKERKKFISQQNAIKTQERHGNHS